MIIVEDGTLVDDANSLVSRADYIAYAVTLGVTIASDSGADVELIKAMEFICWHEGNLKGELVDRDQAVCYPRSALYLEGFYWDEDEIPRQAILCQMNLALDIHDGVDLFNPPARDNLPIISEKVDVISVAYANPATPARLSKNSSGMALLNLLLRNSGLQSVRLVRA